MSWRMIGKPLMTSDMSGIPTATQKFNSEALSSDYLLKAVTLGVIFYNDPAFTNISVELWSDRSGSAQKLIATSDTFSKAECLVVQSHAFRTFGFSFSSAIPLRAQTAYHIFLRSSGYTGTDSSHIAVKLSYPDPQYGSLITKNAAKGAQHPFDFSIVSADI